MAHTPSTPDTPEADSALVDPVAIVCQSCGYEAEVENDVADRLALAHEAEKESGYCTTVILMPSLVAA